MRSIMNVFKNMAEMLIAVVIPSYRVTLSILDVIAKIGPEVAKIYVVDDCCPDKSGLFVTSMCKDDRVRVLFNKENQGVGGAVMAGYAAAVSDGMDIIVKIDGDDQMDPMLIPQFVAPIIAGRADYTKGNRFFDLQEVRSMPPIRIFGNTILSFMTKFSSGYWEIFDPTNGYTAIHSSVASLLPTAKISRRYFFETDVLFRLNTLRAVVSDIPMTAKYGDETSHLKISKVVGEFFFKHIRNFIKRIGYNYYLRDMSIASVELPVGIIMLAVGGVFGLVHWASSLKSGIATPAGTVMLAALPIIVGVQFVLSFIGHDVAATPRDVLHLKIKSLSKSNA